MRPRKPTLQSIITLSIIHTLKFKFWMYGWTTFMARNDWFIYKCEKNQPPIRRTAPKWQILLIPFKDKIMEHIKSNKLSTIYWTLSTQHKVFFSGCMLLQSFWVESCTNNFFPSHTPYHNTQEWPWVTNNGGIWR